MTVYEIIKAVKWEGHSSEGLYINKDAAIINLHFVADRHNKESKLIFAESDEEDLLKGELVKWNGERYEGEMGSIYIKEREVNV